LNLDSETMASAAMDVDSLVEKLRAAGVVIPPGRVTADHFGDSPELSDELIALIRSGAKRAGTSLIWAMEIDGDPMPTEGDISIVLDHRDEPVLLTRVTQVEVATFESVTAEYAAIEGEGDGSLAFWREGHWNFFSRECARIGREPTWDMPVVCTVFEVLRSASLTKS
jgi:uncharacterized protein YhfF